MKTLVHHVTIKKHIKNQLIDAEDELAIEEPLEIRISYLENSKRLSKSISVTMRTPGNDSELAAGFLFTEGVIQHNNQVQTIKETLPGVNIVEVVLKENVLPVLPKSDRNFYTTSSCGVCGKSSIDAIRTVSIFHGNDDEGLEVNPVIFYGLQEKLKEQQLIFQTTGGLHAAAIFDEEGTLLMLREDVGRHNAVDKLVGAALLNNELPLKRSILLLSGRASFELLQKATMAGIKIVAAVGAPSSLAVELAKQAGITLIGFLRSERFNIYSNPERVKHQAALQL